MVFQKLSLRLMMSVLALALFSAPAFAEHGGGGGVGGGGYSSYDRVIYQASRLNDVVQYSWLRSHVKSAVSRFYSATIQLRRCGWGSRYSDSSVGFYEHGGYPGYPTYPSNCGWVTTEVRRSWSEVERYLYDTSYDYPQVYSEYLRTRDALWRAGL